MACQVFTTAAPVSIVAKEEAAGMASDAAEGAEMEAGEVPSPRELCERAGIKKAVDLVFFAVYYHAQFLGRAPSAKQVRQVLEQMGNQAAMRSASTYLSRAKAKGLVYEQNRIWHLTDAGLAEMRRRLGQEG